MRSALEEEVILRARALAAAGPDALFGGLHERVRWQAPTLSLVKSVDYSHRANAQQLTVIPLIFARGALICQICDPKVIAVSYQARGTVALADKSRAHAAVSIDAPSRRLVALLGRGRAAVLHSLAEPSTTAGLATRLGLAPSSVSEHLSGLADAGMVHRRRVGRRVFYGLEPAGETLVSMLAVDSGDDLQG
jgi:DNA-binding transcriptional ArsR family regulator